MIKTNTPREAAGTVSYVSNCFQFKSKLMNLAGTQDKFPSAVKFGETKSCVISKQVDFTDAWN